MRRANRGLLERFLGRPPARRRSARPPAVERLEERSLLSAARPLHALRSHTPPVKLPRAYQQINLVSDFPTGVEGVNPQLSDPNLLNPWGLTASPTSPFWAADQVSGVSTIYTINSRLGVTKAPLTVTIPKPASTPTPTTGFNPLTGPTGIVFNGTQDFKIPTPSGGSVPATFLFATLDGTLAGWNPQSIGGTTAVVVANAGPREEFTGLALGQVGTANFLYTADPRSSTGIDVFNASFQPVVLDGVPQGTGTGFASQAFVDPQLPPGFSPYNIQNIDGHLFVTYTTPASGGGYVAEFDTRGNFIRQFAGNGSGGPLQAPWGLALAPSDFGRFSNALLVGNFGDGRINAYNFRTGRFLGQLTDPRGNPIVIPFLWALHFGNGQNAGPTNTLFFTAGIAGQYHGLLGALQPVHRVR
ncbi:MAG: TIGR03118 family protein [Isosphaeraceae bacterium]|nr:TIGR03118 family protein [Isosphaeraceae bacterium]